MSFPAFALAVVIIWGVYQIGAIIWRAYESDREDAQRLNSKGAYYEKALVRVKIENDHE